MIVGRCVEAMLRYGARAYELHEDVELAVAWIEAHPEAGVETRAEDVKGTEL